MDDNEVLIKSKKRVQQHGEVFTPKAIVDAMVTLPGLDEVITQPATTVLEPAAGEGAFLVNILERRLSILAEQFSDDLVRFENFSLLAISSLYGIELLNDNLKKCVINLFVTFHDFYKDIAAKFDQQPKSNVEESAKMLIITNIVQGDFLKRTTVSDSPIVFSEWAPIRLTKTTKHINVIRTEYTLQEIFQKVKREPGSVYTPIPKTEQLGLFEQQAVLPIVPIFKYLPTPITEVYKETREEIIE
ncbi:MAG: SAM-dependent DNA methyltransferase [Chloroflexi bacterium]|nr:SAM-dependent DNA methyltransferase [Chloroflexota bacterium]